MNSVRTVPARRLLGGFETKQAPGYALYVITLLCQVLSAFTRAVIVYIVLEGIGLFAPWSIPAESIGLVVGYAPLVVSLLALICPPLVCPIAGSWWEMNSGGREPEPDELESFERAIGTIQLEDPTLKPPRHWFVAEDAAHNAAVFGNSLQVNRGLLESPEDVAGFISHEYQHLRSGDGRMMCALEVLVLLRMETPKLSPLRSLPVRGLLWVAGGQAVMWFLANPWETYWRSREHAADDYTISVGQGPAFARSLRFHALPFERPVRRMRYSRASHPYTKPRMSRLEGMPEPFAGVGQ